MSDALFIPDDRLCDYLDEGKGAAKECEYCGEIYCPNAGEAVCPYCPTEDDDDETEDRP